MGLEVEIQPSRFYSSILDSGAVLSDLPHMKLSLPQIGSSQHTRQGRAGRRVAGTTRRDTGNPAKGERPMQSQARSGRMEAVAPHPLAELLECPPATGNLLNGATVSIDFVAGDVLFSQSEISRGLFVVISGRLLRRTERMHAHLLLGPVRAGELVELAAVLGDGCHTYTLTAQSSGSALLLPIQALSLAFQQYPPLRMHLLEELAREVSRAYNACRMTRTTNARKRGPDALGE
jgi:hypothetical protein